MALPILTPAQRAQALETAAEARLARKRLLDQVKTGELSITAVLARGKSDRVVAKTRITQLLRAFPGIGAVRAASVMEQAGIAETRRVGGLGPRQHDALVEALS